MGEKEELLMELNRVNYRNNILGIIEVKLLQMKEIAKQAKEENLSALESEILKARLNDLAAQVNAIEQEIGNIVNEGVDE
jgi:hypothetical protein